MNSDLKNNVESKPQPWNDDEIQTSAEELFMAFLSEKSEHVVSYFDHEKVAYPKIKDDDSKNQN